MGIAGILGIITQIPILIEDVVKIVDNAKDVLSSDDAKTLDDALAAIQKQNDEGYAALRAKLQAAAQK